MQGSCAAVQLEGTGLEPVRFGGIGPPAVAPCGVGPPAAPAPAPSERLPPGSAFSWTPPALPHLRIQVRLRSKLTCRLPPFLGSTLRGALGMALRRAVCTQGMDTLCRRCALRHGCVYTRVFETYVEGEPPPLMGGSIHAPRPLVLEPRSRRRRFATGDLLEFDLLLFGSAARYHPLLALAVERMAKTGLGARRAPFALDSLRFEEHDGRWPEVVPGQAPGATGSLRLHFLTPTRLLVHKRLERQPTFRTLAFKMARRMLELAYFHVPGTRLEWDLEPFLTRAEAVLIRRSSLQWIDLERFSNRQRRKLPAGGLVGSLDLEGDLGPFLPLLRAASVVHFGKGTPMGLGRVAVEEGG